MKIKTLKLKSYNTFYPKKKNSKISNHKKKYQRQSYKIKDLKKVQKK